MHKTYEDPPDQYDLSMYSQQISLSWKQVCFVLHWDMVSSVLVKIYSQLLIRPLLLLT